MPKTPPPALVLRYVGTRGFVPGVPARDLTDADLARLVRQRTALRPGEQGFDAALEDRTAALVRSGQYEAIAPPDAPRPKSAKPSPPPEPAAPPAEPETTTTEVSTDA